LLKKYFEVLGFVTPGTGMKHIKGTSMGKTKQLSKEDVVVIWGAGGVRMTLLKMTPQWV